MKRLLLREAALSSRDNESGTVLASAELIQRVRIMAMLADAPWRMPR